MQKLEKLLPQEQALQITFALLKDAGCKKNIRNNGFLLLSAMALAACSNSDNTSASTGIRAQAITNINASQVGNVGQRDLYQIDINLFNTAAENLSADEDTDKFKTSSKFKISGGKADSVGSETEFDELQFTGSGKVDLSSASSEIVERLNSLEIFDINGSGNNEIILTVASVRAISDASFGGDDIVIVRGGSGDKLTLEDSGWNIVNGGLLIMQRGEGDNSQTVYNVFENGSARIAVPQNKEFVVGRPEGNNSNETFADFNANANNLYFGSDIGDTINGGDGADTIIGNNGNDVLNGGGGNDILDGGGGSDIFAVAEGDDRIMDFANGIRGENDKLDFRGFSKDSEGSQPIDELAFSKSGNALQINGRGYFKTESTNSETSFDIILENVFGENTTFGTLTVNAVEDLLESSAGISRFFIGVADATDMA